MRGLLRSFYLIFFAEQYDYVSSPDGRSYVFRRKDSPDETITVREGEIVKTGDDWYRANGHPINDVGTATICSSKNNQTEFRLDRSVREYPLDRTSPPMVYSWSVSVMIQKNLFGSSSVKFVRMQVPQSDEFVPMSSSVSQPVFIRTDKELKNCIPVLEKINQNLSIKTGDSLDAFAAAIQGGVTTFIKL